MDKLIKRSSKQLIRKSKIGHLDDKNVIMKKIENNFYEKLCKKIGNFFEKIGKNYEKNEIKILK